MEIERLSDNSRRKILWDNCSDAEILAYLYDEITDRVERDLRPKAESVRFLLDLVALDYPQAQRMTEKDSSGLSLLEEILRSGFIEQIYGK